MASRAEMVRARRDELLAMGYNHTVVDLALEWAEGCAGGMADYALKESGEDSDHEALVVQLLPRYLKDCEIWMRSFGNRPAR